jgi:hypothetical protein
MSSVSRPSMRLAFEQDGALVGLVFDQAHQRFENGGLTGAVVA